MLAPSPISYVKHRRGRSSGLLSFEIDQKSMDRIERKLRRASGKNLYTVLQRANLSRGDELAKRMAATAPRYTGNLRRSIKARPEKAGSRFLGTLRSTTTVLVGPTAPHRHLVIQGTKERPSGKGGSGYTRTGKEFVGTKALGWRAKVGTYTVGRMRPNPFVDRAAQGFAGKLADYVRGEWRKLLY